MTMNDLDRVFSKLEILDKKLDDIKDHFYQRMTDIEVKHAELNVKAGIWGLLGGVLSILTFIAIQMIFKK